ncbi:phosphoenolpyruvate carboxylase [Flexivirga oryzae]|uniref:Uncharacterized protein n=1 Tax=Flexivirga oryzae TaxID=1794944 RepID=A0A839N4G2_9MICO|nr:phosphoenolpyruvate carboxylase [Flexivirga oryzae]MBB2890954.1 hypothetical protein [Flexivirga oryzae]
MASDLSLFGGTGSSTALTGQPLGRGVSKQVKKSTDLVVGRGAVAYTTDTVRAGLTYSALNNIGTLVGAAEQLMQVAPGGQAYYEACLNAYALGAANAIARFQ